MTNDGEDQTTMVKPTSRAESIRKMRAHLMEKLEILTNTTNDKEIDQDVLFERYDEQRFTEWLKEDENRILEEEIHYLYISSAARDRTRWPNPGEYNVDIDGELTNIVRCDLVQFSFPMTEPTVTQYNSMVRFSIAPHATVYSVSIPSGNYLGAELAVEITRQMNQTIYASDIIAGTYYIDTTDGLMYNTADDAYAPESQFRVTFNRVQHKFVFQLLDSTGVVDSATAGAIYVRPKQGAINTLVPDDIFAVLGFNRDLVAQEGVFDVGTGAYALYTTTSYMDFGPAEDVDSRFTYSVRGNQVAELNSDRAIILDIPQLNDNDVSQTKSETRFKTGDIFGVVLQRDPATVCDRTLENSNANYPVQKHYREGRSRINQLTIRIRRVDGSLCTFGGADHIFTLRFTMRRTQPKKSVFAR